MSRARTDGESLRRVLVVWLSLGWLFVTSVILLVPRHSEIGDGQCSFKIPDVVAFAYDGERILNVLMFMPIGLLCLYLGRTARQRVLLGVAILAMPPVFEALQGTNLIGRTCSATDVIDNWTGAVLGMGIAGGFILLDRRSQREPGMTSHSREDV